MTTGATLYLVSACATAEEFVAAFRRYADRTGLFVPSAAPLPAGRRGRLALTLNDGGIMIEGEAEILQSSVKPTVLHGRPGMTIKFVDADDLSKTVITELEKARLAMKPAPPSVPPRRSDVPAEPRPVVPAVGGRIDAANALAECVVIGDPATLADTSKLNESGKAKFVVPLIPAVGSPRPNSPSTPPPMRPNTPSSPPPVSGVPAAIGASPSGGASRPKTPSVPPDPTSKPLPAPAPSKSGPAGAKLTSIGFPAIEKAPAFPPKTQVPGAPPAENPLLDTKRGLEAPPNRTKEISAATAPGSALLDTALGTKAPERAVSNATTLGMPALEKPPAASGRAISVHDEATSIGELPPTPAPVQPKTDAAAAAAVQNVDETTAVGMEPPQPPTKTDPMPTAAPKPATPSPTPPGGTAANPSAVASKPSVPAAATAAAAPPAAEAPVVATPGKPQHRATSIGFPAMRTPFQTQPVGVVRTFDPNAPAPPVIPDGSSAKPGAGSPGPRGKSPTRPPLTPRHPTPVAPVPIVRSPAKAAPAIEDAIVENAIEEEEKTDLSELPLPPSKSGSMPPAIASPGSAGARSTLGGSAESIDSPDKVASSRSGGMRASEIMAAIPSGDWTMSPDASGPTVLPGDAPPVPRPPVVEAEPTPGPAPAPTMPAKGPPTGNWSISLDPDTGWSEPVKLAKADAPAAAAPAAPAAPAAEAKAAGKKRKDRSATSGNPDKAIADEKGFTAVEWEDKPTGIGEAKIEIDSTLMEPLKPMPALDDDDDDDDDDAAPPPLPRGARSNPAAIRYVTPPAGLAAVPADSPFAAPAGASPFEAAPAEPPPAATPPFAAPAPFAPAPGLLMTERVAPRPFTPPAGLPAVPPGASMPMPVAGYSSPGMPAATPGLFARSASQPVADPNAQFGMMGFQQPAFSGAAAFAPAAASKRKKQNLIIGVGALAALAGGFVLVLVLAGGKDKKTEPRAGQGSGSAKVVERGSSDAVGSGSAEPAVGSGSGDTVVEEPAGSGSGSGSAVAAVDVPDAGTEQQETPTPATGGPCKVYIASTPSGAEVFQGGKKLGTTPLDTELPCGVEAKLNLKKAKFINTGRSFTPTEGKGNKVVVKLAKTTFTVKVTSTPAGATITVGGKSLGVTPATVRLPAFETAAIMVSKPGFKTDSKAFTPKSNNISHHVVLKKGR